MKSVLDIMTINWHYHTKFEWTFWSNCFKRKLELKRVRWNDKITKANKFYDYWYRKRKIKTICSSNKHVGQIAIQSGIQKLKALLIL